MSYNVSHLCVSVYIFSARHIICFPLIVSDFLFIYRNIVFFGLCLIMCLIVCLVIYFHRATHFMLSIFCFRFFVHLSEYYLIVFFDLCLIMYRFMCIVIYFHPPTHSVTHYMLSIYLFSSQHTHYMRFF